MRNLVLFLDSSLFGGIESHIIELVKLMQSKHVPTSVLFYQDHLNHQLYDLLTELNCPYQCLGGSALDLFHFLKHSDNYVLHTHGYKAGIIGRLTCKITGHTCISTYHAGEKGSGRIRLYNWLDQITSGFSKNLVVANQLKSKVKNGQFIANFILPKNPHPKEPEKQLNIAFVGRLAYEKAPERFIKLATHFQHQENIKFHLYGDGPMIAELQKKASNNTLFHGHKSTQKLWQHVDILVICSREEGLPMVLLEAIDNKVLCIANAVGAIDSVIINNHTGLLTDDQSHQALVSKLREALLMSQQERNYLVKNATSQLHQFYAGKSQYIQLIKLYLN
ncbi:glycosyltransferase family 4 protein [Pseudoalteromonas sp.]|uniref:glycosyltransferase family 4 protein n=1 Tax=Pseudoalteromonas sp. TaxID=53249 RepID=UPI003567DA8C